MTVEQLAIICQAHELIEAGSTHCKLINTAYKLIPDHKKTVTRKQKIIAINDYFNKVRAETLARMIVKKQINEKAGQNIIITGFTFETFNAG